MALLQVLCISLTPIYEFLARRVRACITLAINDHVGYLETPRSYQRPAVGIETQSHFLLVFLLLSLYPTLTSNMYLKAISPKL